MADFGRIRPDMQQQNTIKRAKKKDLRKKSSTEKSPTKKVLLKKSHTIEKSYKKELLLTKVKLNKYSNVEIS